MIKIKTVKTATKMALSRAQIGLRPLLRITEQGDKHYCPCCDTRLRRFKPYGVVPRPNALCGVCGSLERDRLMHLFLVRRTDLFDGRPKKLLHIAPEPQLASLFQSKEYIDYLSADLFDVSAMVKMDITDIQFPANSFHIIYCSHVLEHVPDDRRAIRELCRVLKPGGWAILQVPITADTTFEDSSITNPRERERLFGQHDHVRRYGPDYKDRLTEAGFTVTVDDFATGFDGEAAIQLGVNADERIFYCRKFALDKD
jgi:SAM-dependent methyltransferase